MHVQLAVCIFVDNFMLTCVSDRQLDIFMAQLRVRFRDVTEWTGPTHNELPRHGLRFLHSGKVQRHYAWICEVKLSQKYPTNGDLFVRDVNALPLVETLRAEFHSRVYAVIYMG